MRTDIEIINSIAALKQFQAANPNIANQNNIIRFYAHVHWSFINDEPIDDSDLLVRWDYGSYYYADVVIERGNCVEAAEHYHDNFSPRFQLYSYDKQSNTLQIKDHRNYYKVSIRPNPEQPHNNFIPQ